MLLGCVRRVCEHGEGVIIGCVNMVCEGVHTENSFGSWHVPLVSDND